MIDIILLIGAVIAVIVYLIWWLLNKVAVPSISVGIDKTQYSRGETVIISGTVTRAGSGVPNETVSFAIQPPSGDAYAPAAVVTNSQGEFSQTWVIPNDALEGSYTLTAGALGVSATATFTCKPSEVKE